MVEQWKAVVGYEGIYEVSNQGRVKRIKAYNTTHIGRILQPGKTKKGYYLVVLCKEGIRHSSLVSRLVLKAFIGLPKPGQECNHKNGIKADNYPDNLEWLTHKENSLHAYRVLGKGRGEIHCNAKLKNKDIPFIRRLLAEGKLLQREIATMFGVDRTTIGHIKSCNTWGHI